MKIGRYNVPAQIDEVVARGLIGNTDGLCSAGRNGIQFFSYVCDAQLKPATAISGSGHAVWLAVNPTIRRLRVSLKARCRNGCIDWAVARSLKVLVKENSVVIKDRVMETHRTAPECRYGEWSQPFECRTSGKEGLITEVSDLEMEAHFTVFCPNTAEPANILEEIEVEMTDKSIFLSHVSADKDPIVRPFAKALADLGVGFWLDEAEIEWGDDIVREVNKGLAMATYVVCFISDSFADRNWPMTELSSLLSLQLADGVKRVLPIIVGDENAVLGRLPILRGIRYQKWDPANPTTLALKLKDMIAKAKVLGP